MYTVTLKERLSATEAKLAATEKLLELERREHELTKRSAADWKASHAMQQRNTKAFFDAARTAEGKLTRVRSIIESDEESREKVGDIRRLLSDD